MTREEEIEESKARAAALGLGWPPQVREHERDGRTYIPVATFHDGVPVEVYASASVAVADAMMELGYAAVFLKEYGLGTLWVIRP